MKKYDHFIYPPMVRLPSFNNMYESLNIPQTPQNFNIPNYYDYYYNLYPERFYNSFNYPNYFNNSNPLTGLKKYVPIIKKIIRYISPVLAIVISVITGFIII